jgi:hypothetical protein
LCLGRLPRFLGLPKLAHLTRQGLPQRPGLALRPTELLAQFRHYGRRCQCGVPFRPQARFHFTESRNGIG